MSRYIRRDELHTGFNFGSLGASWCGAQWRRVIDESLASDGSVGAPTTWVTENHDWRRAATRYAVEQRLKAREMPTEEQLNVSIFIEKSIVFGADPPCFRAFSLAVAALSRLCLPCAPAAPTSLLSRHYLLIRMQVSSARLRLPVQRPSVQPPLVASCCRFISRCHRASASTPALTLQFF